MQEGGAALAESQVLAPAGGGVLRGGRRVSVPGCQQGWERRALLLGVRGLHPITEGRPRIGEGEGGRPGRGAPERQGEKPRRNANGARWLEAGAASVRAGERLDGEVFSASTLPSCFCSPPPPHGPRRGAPAPLRKARAGAQASSAGLSRGLLSVFNKGAVDSVTWDEDFCPPAEGWVLAHPIRERGTPTSGRGALFLPPSLSRPRTRRGAGSAHGRSASVATSGSAGRPVWQTPRGATSRRTAPGAHAALGPLPRASAAAGSGRAPRRLLF